MQSINSFNTLTNLTISGKNYVYFNLKALSQQFNFDLNKVPISIKILLENLIRNEDGDSITKEMIEIFEPRVEGVFIKLSKLDNALNVTVFYNITNGIRNQEINFTVTRTR